MPWVQTEGGKGLLGFGEGGLWTLLQEPIDGEKQPDGGKQLSMGCLVTSNLGGTRGRKEKGGSCKNGGWAIHSMIEGMGTNSGGQKGNSEKPC